MIPTKYDFKTFVEEIKDLNFNEMHSATERKLTEAENQKLNSLVNEIGEFLFFLNSGIKPSSVSEFNWPLYIIPTEKLIEKGQLEPSILGIFKDV